MGCDIHCYIEAARPGNPKYWRSFGAKFNPGRDYTAFGKIAGVRRGDALIPPRGLPTDMGYRASDESHLYVVDDGDPAADQPGFCTKSKAISYGNPIIDNLTLHPDWHSHTWLTTAEWKAAIAAAEADPGPMPGKCDSFYHAMTAAMEELERQGNEVRVVIWFDN